MANKVPNFTTGSAATTAHRQTGMSVGSYYNADPGISVRAPMTRENYEYFRPNERIPTGSSQQDLRQIMVMSRACYERVGVVRSVVDMMSEFGAEGVEILHPDAEPQAFYKAWSDKVNLTDRCERFLSWLYKSGNTVVRRSYGKIKDKDLKKLKNNTQVFDAGGNGRIPIEYTFYNPATIELVGDHFGALARNKIHGLRIPYTFFEGYRNPRTPLEKEVYDTLPIELKQALEGRTHKEGIYVLPIPTDRLHVAYYKKDDCDIWGKSFIYSILDDIIYNDKLKLAKTSALDSWYNVIRLWQVGDHKTTPPIPMTPEAGAKLAALLEGNTGGGGVDLIWDSAIKMDELYPRIEQLVNFEENIHNILLGLGVPEGLVGGRAEGSSGMTQNYLGLKNLIKRLEAGRRALKTWLNLEIDIIQKEMGFKKRPIIRFAHTDLHDEQTYFNLLIQLLDRNVISDTTVLERVNEIPEIERRRIKEESDMRDEEDIPEKASPFHKPDLEQQQQHEMEKIKHTAKMNLEFAPPTKGPDNSSNVQKRKNKTSVKKGRPAGSKDKTTRKRGGNRIKSPRAALLVEAARIYDLVDDFVRRNAMGVYNVTTARQLTANQEQEIDKIKLATFAHIEPFTEITDEVLFECMAAQEGPIDDFLDCYNDSLQDLGSESINQDQKRILRTSAYADVWCIDDEEDEDIDE